MTDRYMDRAREIVAPYFATDGEEESERVARAVELLLTDIAAALKEAAGEERERCAKVAETGCVKDVGPGDSAYYLACGHIAAAIRTPPPESKEG